MDELVKQVSKGKIRLKAELIGLKQLIVSAEVQSSLSDFEKEILELTKEMLVNAQNSAKVLFKNKANQG